MKAGRKLLLSAFVAQSTSHLLEWIAYHRAIGVTEICFFTDARKSDQYPLLDALARANMITHVPVVVDSDPTGEIHNSAIRAARIEASKSGGYGLYLTTDEYFYLPDGDKDIQSLIQSLDGVDVLTVPTSLAGIGNNETHTAGAILGNLRPIAPMAKDAPLRSLVRFGLFAGRTPQVPTGPLHGEKQCDWRGGHGDPMPEPHSMLNWALNPKARDTLRAAIIKIPAPSLEGLLLSNPNLPVSFQLDAIAQADTLTAIKGDNLDLTAWHSTIAKELSTLLSNPAVAAAQNAICSKEINTLRSMSDDTPDTNQPTDVATEITDPETPPQSTNALPNWFAEIHTSGDQEGFYTRLKNHAVTCIRRDAKKLVVTFDNLSNVNDLSTEREPWAYKFVHDMGCSHLSVMARRKDWFRDKQLITYLTRLSEDGFFADFEKVILTGTSMGGFAALAFASLAPGATVASFNPQTTLDKTLVPWETRFGMGRARDWSLPHSDCAFEIDEVTKAFVFYDPFFQPDHRHVLRLEGDNIIPLKVWCSGHFSPVFLRRAGLLKPIMEHVINDTLTPATFYKLIRQRRTLLWYRKSLESNLRERGHDKLAKAVTPAFRKHRRKLVS